MAMKMCSGSEAFLILRNALPSHDFFPLALSIVLLFSSRFAGGFIAKAFL